MKSFISAVVGSLMVIVGVGIMPSMSNAQIQHHASGTLYGCLSDNLASTLLSTGVFSTYSINISIRCEIGTTAVYRDLP